MDCKIFYRLNGEFIPCVLCEATLRGGEGIVLSAIEQGEKALFCYIVTYLRDICGSCPVFFPARFVFPGLSCISLEDPEGRQKKKKIRG